MRDCICFSKFNDEDDYCVWIENVERCTLELIYIMIVDSQHCDFENVISMPVVAAII